MSDNDEKKAPKKKKHWTIGPLKDFKQQECPACTAIMRPPVLASCFFLLGVLCLILGVIWIISASFAYSTEAFRYDNLCEINEKCTFRFEVEHDLDKPVYLYYRMEGYYQAYRRYLRSRSDNQLRDEDVNDYDRLDDCSPQISHHDDHDKSDIFLPCGLIALSFFNDSFTIMRDNGAKIDQSSKDINFDIYESLYKDPGVDTKGIRVVDSFENPHFITWMNVAALPNFLKIYAIIDEDLPKGHYLMEVKNHYPVRNYHVKKFFKLSTTTWIGGRNFFLGIVLLIVGTISFVFSCCVCVKTKVLPRKLGNIAYLDWNY